MAASTSTSGKAAETKDTSENKQSLSAATVGDGAIDDDDSDDDDSDDEHSDGEDSDVPPPKKRGRKPFRRLYIVTDSESDETSPPNEADKIQVSSTKTKLLAFC